MDFGKLKADVKAATTAAVAALRAAHPDEHFYAFALYTSDDAYGISAAANTEEGLAKRIAAYKFDDPFENEYLRWSTSEWVYEGFDGDEFRPINHAIREVEHSDDDAFEQFRQRIFDLMIDVLAAMDAEGVFGRGQERDRIALLCAVTDSDDDELMDRSVRVLNPPAIVARYDAWLEALRKRPTAG